MSIEALRLLERIAQRPPKRLTELEAIVGNLKVRWAEGEGMGMFFRPALAPPGAPESGHVAPGLSSLDVSFEWDMYHEEPRRPREVALTRVNYTLTLESEEARAKLRSLLGEPRAFSLPEKDVGFLEFGAYFYLPAARASYASLQWCAARPEWAHPRVEKNARTRLLQALVSAMKTATTEQDLVAAVSSQLPACGVEASHPAIYSSAGRYGLSLEFKPTIRVQELVAALGWNEAIATSTDVHMSSWQVFPSTDLSYPSKPHFGIWHVEPALTGWPRGPGRAELPQVARRGPSSCYALQDCATEVHHLMIVPNHGRR